jgi:GNAT superfamily N-acetyltransferase
MFSLKTLSEEEVTGFSEFTFPYYRSVLGEMSTGRRMIAVGAVLFLKAIGLVLAEVKESSRKAVICSIAVAPPQRRTGVATALLQRIEHELIVRGCESAEVIYMAERPSTVAVEGLLRKSGWPVANSRLMICNGDFDHLTKAPWMKHTNFPAAFEVFPWEHLTERERVEILDVQQKETWFPEVLSPFAHEDQIYPGCSLGLRWHGKVIGWCIVHKFGADTLRCSSLFVGKEFAAQGRAVTLLARSIHASCRAGRPNIIFDVSFQRPRMIQFVQRRMAPYLKSIQITKESRKELGSECEA